MASILSLFGTIMIDNTKANKSIDDTTSKAEKSGSKVGSAFGTIAKGAVAVGTAVVDAATTLGGAAFKMAKDTPATADEIDKMSQNRHFTHSLSRVGLRFVTKRYGYKQATRRH